MNKKLLITFSVTAVFIFCLIYYLLFTASGLNMLGRVTETITQDRLKIGTVSGRLAERIHLVNLSYTENDTSFTIKSVTCEWDFFALFQGRLRIIDIILEGVTINSGASEKQSSFDWTATPLLPEIRLPLSIEIGNLQVTQFSYLSDGTEVVEINEAILGLQGEEDSYAIERLSLTMPGFALQLAGTINTTGKWPIDIVGKWQFDKITGGQYTGGISVSDALHKGRADLQVSSPLQANAIIDFNLSQGVHWTTEIETRKFNPEVFSDALSGELAANIQISGKYTNAGFSGEVEIRKFEGMMNSSAVQLTGRFGYSESGVEKALLDAKIANAAIRIEGNIGREADIVYSADIPDIHEIYPPSSGKVQVAGNIRGLLARPQVNGTITGSNLKIENLSIPMLSGEFSGEAAEDGEFSTIFSLNNTVVGKRTIENIVFSGEGKADEHRLNLQLVNDKQSMKLKAKGRLNDQGWRGEIYELVAHDAQNGSIALENPAGMVVEKNHYELESLCLAHEKGSFCIKAEVQGSMWQAKANLKGFDPGFFIKAWPGELHAEVTGSGNFSDSEKMVSVQLKHLDGQLKDIPLSGSGNVVLSKGEIYCEGLSLQYGDADIKANGRLSDAYDFNFSGNIPNLQQLIPDYSGEIFFGGKIAGDRRRPDLLLDLRASNGKIAGVQIKALEGGIAVKLVEDGKIQADIRATDISYQDVSLFNGVVQVNGTTEDHNIALQATTNQGDLALEVQGGYNEYWQGILSSGSLLLNSYGNWTLGKAAAIRIGTDHSSVNEFCVEGSYAAFCVDASYSEGNVWNMYANIKELSLDFLNDFALVDFPIEGSLTGDLQAGGVKANLSELKLSAAIPELQIAEDEIEANRIYTFKQSSIRADYGDGIIAAVTESTFADGGKLAGRLNLNTIDGNLEYIYDAEMNGEVAVDIADLSFISIITNSRVEPRGSLKGNTSISGTPRAPRISGNMKLEDGELEIAELGVTLTDITVEIFNRAKSLGFLLSTRSGEGELQGRGEVAFSDSGNPALQCTFMGENFELIATEEYVIRVTPDVQLLLNDEETSLSGRINIPYARINWKPAEDLISPSNDIIIISEDDEIYHKKKELSTDLQLVLGEDVEFAAFGLNSRLQGDLKLQNFSDKPLALLGELRVVDGKFSFYTAELDITEGRLSFSGGPVEDPGVEIRAVRIVEKKTVGIDVSGSAQELDVQLFSEPFMDETSILSYLLVGSSLDSSTANELSALGRAASSLGLTGINSLTSGIDSFVPLDEIYFDGSEQGDTSLVLGKYLTKDLFVGYDHNLFDNIGEFKVRYNLGRGFSVETQSSVNATSGDLLYSIER